MPSSIARHLSDPLLLYLLVALFLGTQLTYSLGAFSNQTSLPCLSDQASALLQIRRTFLPTNKAATAFRSWRAGKDCCHWEGVGCGEDGYVTSLDLADWGLESAALDPVIFSLTSLRYLDLAVNDFNGSNLPSFGFERLTALIHLNLSASNFQGRIPVGIGRLTKLVSLDLSSAYVIEHDTGATRYSSFPLRKKKSFASIPNYAWQLLEPNIWSLVANLSNLKELYLDNVDLSDNGAHWCSAFANSSTPQLQVLSLRNSHLSDPICRSLSSLRALTEINLLLNHLYGQIPEFFADLSSLRVLVLANNSLEGLFPTRIFQHRNLTTVDIRYNPYISGSLPNFSSNNSLTTLLVSNTNFSGPIPNSISNLRYIKELGLAASGDSQELPSSIGKLKFLKLLEVTGVAIEGAIPSWVINLTSLETLRFSNCGLSGEVPSSIDHLRNLTILELYKCNFSGILPPQIFNLTQLEILDLHSNNFLGAVELRLFLKLPRLIGLNLSNNKLVVVEDMSDSLPPPHKLCTLRLASCNISKLPNVLRHIHEIRFLDLSNNQIHGSIPQWAWETWNYMQILNLSHNKFSSLGDVSVLPVTLSIIDLSFNLFEGPIPIVGPRTQLFDLSNNLFSSFSPNFSSGLANILHLKASRNSLSGRIPPSLCDARSLELLDLSYNNLSGSIRACLMEDINSLSVLVLKENQLQGKLPQNINNYCAFEVLDFSGNSMEGKLPRSLANCRDLQVVNIGNNQITDTFPCWMSTLPKLEVLILKSNKFVGKVGQEEGNCEFKRLRVFDLASNNFSGSLSNEWLKTMKSMMVRSSHKTMSTEFQPYVFWPTYQFTSAITYKGYEVTFAKTLNTLVVIDVSDNAFCGAIPKSIGDLDLLMGVNMSHNSLTGPIPGHIGALHQLEALDLSANYLSGEIPQELASLDFLSTLNLSFNKLVGRIPESPHFLTFSNISFEGNIGLCGVQVSKACNSISPNVVLHHSEKKSVDIIMFLFVVLGFGIGFAAAIILTSLSYDGRKFIMYL